MRLCSPEPLALSRLSPVPFPYLLLPSVWASRNRAHRRESGDLLRGLMFGGIGLVVATALFGGSFWLTWQLAGFAELGDYLLRAGLSWLFLTFLSFLAFSGVVTALSTFFLSDDLRLLLAAPIAPRRLFHARFVRTLAQSSWMVVVFLAPLLLGVGMARCAPLPSTPLRRSRSFRSRSFRWRLEPPRRFFSSTSFRRAGRATS